MGLLGVVGGQLVCWVVVRLAGSGKIFEELSSRTVSYFSQTELILPGQLHCKLRVDYNIFGRQQVFQKAFFGMAWNGCE